ncbi:hypothetical protein [Pedobacter sp. B4-66]|uniref:hypothetical protein n=1 Tax=Pedobacter sp. B4-66 TaxID=2817280 RepID=UPI001BDA644F|nr:hypothetical protein [Pedobacter sp. B4-66]
MKFAIKNPTRFKKVLDQVCLDLKIDFPYQQRIEMVGSVEIIHFDDSFANKLTPEAKQRLMEH